MGATGRAPGWGAGGDEGSAVVVAGTGAGTVRVGGGFGTAVEGVIPSGFAAAGEMGSFLWRGIGGMVGGGFVGGK